jgi:hypothetical protein
MILKTTLYLVTLVLVALVQPLAAHTVEGGGPVHDLLHLLWGYDHTIFVGAFGLLAVTIGVGLALKATGRHSKV